MGGSNSKENSNIRPYTSSASGEGALNAGMFVQTGNGSFSDRYSVISVLGKGSFGEVMRCRDRVTGQECAVKVISKKTAKNKDSVSLLKEVELLKKLDHPNIMKLYEIFEDNTNYYVVGELYTGGELFDEIILRKRFSEIDAARIIKQVFSGITYMHKHHIVHRDLKPENILLQSKDKNSDIKIIDFGLSTHFEGSSKLKDRIGTAYYIAPEVLRGTYDEKCDIWSAGVILYILLCGSPPFYGKNEYEILKRVETGKYAFDLPQWKRVSEDAKDLIRRMLAFHPSLRVTAEQCLEHQWIQKFATESATIQDLPCLESTVTNMRLFQAEQKLAQAALLYMASKLTTMEETKQLTEIFRKLDTNNDGMLDRKELIQGYKDLVKLKGHDIAQIDQNIVEQQIDSVLATVDFDGNGYMEYSEFVTCAMDRTSLLSRERMERAFQLFDRDGSGKISTEELVKVFGQTENAMPSKELTKILQEVDKNDDGEVDFEEFCTMLTQLCITDQVN